MSNQVFPTATREIGGRIYTVRALAFSEARKAYSKLQRLLAANEEVLAEAGVGLFMFAGLAGAIDDEELKFYIDIFGPTTEAAMSPVITLNLGAEDRRNVVFAGRFEDVFEWLDFCVEHNFSAVIAKLRGVRRALEARQAQQAQNR